MQDTLQKSLTLWDGKDTATLESLFLEFHEGPDFLQGLIALGNDRKFHRGVTWLLKHHFDRKGPALQQDLARSHILQFEAIDDWQARLHVLQYLEHLDLPEDSEKVVSDFVEGSLRSDRTFVRAWAWHGLAVLAERFSLRRDETIKQLTEAQARETAGSVKVRIRRAIAKLQS